ncbi:MAG: hypothetical protein M3003_17295 [Candidatus Dormibacteraeota bacterium]|nr:hypothetical protein [Candidatus Dormibacteraeota bacterium]
MRLDWALLANAAEGPPNGLVYVLGAGIDTLWRDQFPAPFGGAMVLRLVTSRLESERAHTVEVHCSNEDGKAILVQPIVLTVPPRQVPSEHPPGWDLAANIVINLAGIQIEKPGFYRFEIMVDDQQVRTLPFRLVDTTRVDPTTLV